METWIKGLVWSNSKKWFDGIITKIDVDRNENGVQEWLIVKCFLWYMARERRATV